MDGVYHGHGVFTVITIYDNVAADKYTLGSDKGIINQ